MAAKNKAATPELANFVNLPEKDKGGRPPREIDEDIIIALAAHDLNVTQICFSLKLSTQTLYAKFSKEKVQELMDKGREMGTARLMTKAYTLADNGDASLLRFLIRKRNPEYANVVEHRGKIAHAHAHLHVHRITDRVELEKRILELQPMALQLIAQGSAPQGVVKNSNEGEQNALRRRNTRSARGRRTR